MLQEVTDEFAQVVECGMTYAMVSADDDEFWLFEAAMDGARTVTAAFTDPLICDTDGTPLRHERGARVVDGYFHYTTKLGVHCYRCDRSIKVSVPTHMLLCEEGFEMEAAPKSAGKGAKRLPMAVYESILDQLPGEE